ncbi:hypothetical protein AQUCO_00100384v1 [Aquilegia coerulea]|uniref:Major facilitator superfamily (MFS) profile domain-containing protein n=1 Tax=Aquilegia coerulea TaxID=218851 RepID=A0A2G5FA31_AQUCA|nr:hypothetical protein AQUCO_00100384v1 [Aquilegia coerulea]
METSLDPNMLTQQPSRKKGGFRTMPFIIANEAFERVASFGLLPNMTRYLMGGYHMDVATGTYVLSIWSAATNFFPVVGAFISDSFLGRYRTIVVGCVTSLLGMILLWLTAMIPQAKPPPCEALSKSCKSSSTAQLAFLFASFVLMSIGAGGIRPCSLAFGADQWDKDGNPKMSVAAFRKRHIDLPKSKEACYHYIKGSKIVVPTDMLRCLNKACIIINKEKDVKTDGSATDPWSLCTVEQVEELKALLKVMPIWSTGIIIAVNISQQTFPYLQASSMDRHITSNFQIPAGSFGMFTVLTLIIWIAVYDRLIIPQLAKLTGKPYGIGLKQRIGIGLALSCMAMATSAIVENMRRKTAIRQGFADNPQGILNMSAMWLVPQHCLTGLAEAFNAIGQTEFYYSQFPRSMSSIATSLFGLGMAVGSLLVSVIVKMVDDATKGEGKESWVSSNLNKGHYDYYYWILTILSVMNFLYFLVCSWAYGPCEGERTKVPSEGDDEGMREEEPCSESRTVDSSA